MVDVGALNSPRGGGGGGGGHSRTGSAVGFGDNGGGGAAGGGTVAGLLSPEILRSSSDLELAERIYRQPLGAKRSSRRRWLFSKNVALLSTSRYKMRKKTFREGLCMLKNIV